mgnify:CR=1 FL=1|tara:strand:+ start:236 stop:487 length:252 start_codon:yes stop_codon:yes gene_type:complete
MKPFTIEELMEEVDNPSLNVTLTESEISVILCQLEEKVASYDDYQAQCLVVPDIESIFAKLEGVVNKYYDSKETVTENVEIAP